MHGSDSLYKRMATTTFRKDTVTDPDLEHKVKKVADRHSETFNIIANEPSLAFFRIQEHVRKTLPQLVHHKHEVEDIQVKVQGACFDTEYASNAVKAMLSSTVHFQNIQDLLKNALFMKQQINFVENKRKQDRPSPTSLPGSDPVSEEAGTGQGVLNDGSVTETGQSMDSSVDASACLQNEAVNLTKPMETLDQDKEVEKIMPSSSDYT